MMSKRRRSVAARARLTLVALCLALSGCASRTFPYPDDADAIRAALDFIMSVPDDAPMRISATAVDFVQIVTPSRHDAFILDLLRTEVGAGHGIDFFINGLLDPSGFQYVLDHPRFPPQLLFVAVSIDENQKLFALDPVAINRSEAFSRGIVDSAADLDPASFCSASIYSSNTWTSTKVIFYRLDLPRFLDDELQACLSYSLDLAKGLSSLARSTDMPVPTSPDARQAVLSAAYNCAARGETLFDPERRSNGGLTALPSVACMKQELERVAADQAP